MKNLQSFGTVSCVQIVLHHLLKELPIEVVSSNVVHILHLIEHNKDYSFGQVCICNFYHSLNTFGTHHEVTYYVLATFFVSLFPICSFNVILSVIQHLNYRLLGFRLYEQKCPVDIVNAVLDKVIQVFIYFQSILSYVINFFTIAYILLRSPSPFPSMPLGKDGVRGM